MPYSTGKDTSACPASKPFAVKNRDTGRVVPGGCHATQAEAQKHLAALNANVMDANIRRASGRSA